MLQRILNAIYSFFAAVANILGFGAPPAPAWQWTERDELGNANAEINRLFKDYMKEEAIKAGQFALRVDGVLVMSTAYTWAEPEYRITEPGSVMRIASCSKAFTTAALVQLLPPRGSLSPETKVFELLGITQNDPRVSPDPEPADPRVRDITVQHLLEHTGGWDYRTTPLDEAQDWIGKLKEVGRGMGLHRPPTKDEFARFMFNIPLDFAPGGSPPVYSNIGYLLLGMVIEKASGRTYLDFLREAVLAPPLTVVGDPPAAVVTPEAITDVFVGQTRLSGRRPEEVIYEDPFVGPDATADPFAPDTAPLPYGGAGWMTEVMDSSGGLVTSARSLSLHISRNDVAFTRLNNPVDAGRSTGRRDGGMAGTTAVATSFDGKNGSRKYDMAFIFNQRDKSTKEGVVTSPRLDSFVRALRSQVQADF